MTWGDLRESVTWEICGVSMAGVSGLCGFFLGVMRGHHPRNHKMSFRATLTSSMNTSARGFQMETCVLFVFFFFFAGRGGVLGKSLKSPYSIYSYRPQMGPGVHFFPLESCCLSLFRISLFCIQQVLLLSRVCALFLIFLYVCFIYFHLKTHKACIECFFLGIF